MLTVFIGLILGTKKIKDRRTPTCFGQQLLSSSCQSPSVAPTATRLFTGSSRKQEMRDCKGIKILLAICPSSHRSEDFLPQPEVSWNLRMRCVSFLPTLSLLSRFPARWASCHVPCASFSLRSASTAGAFAKFGFCCAWPPPCRGHAEVVSASLNLRNGTIDDGGLCDFLGSVSPQQKFEVMDRPVLYLSFI